MNMHNTELMRQHQAHKERQARMSAPLMKTEDAKKLRADLQDAKEEIATIQTSLAQSADTIHKMIMERSDLEALILIQAKRLCQLENITAKPDSDARSVVSIIKEVLLDYPGLTVDDICGTSRAQYIVVPRHKAMAKVYEERQELSLGDIGKHFGGRDHSTVLNAIQKHGVCRGGTA